MSRYTMQLRTVIDICGEDTVKSWFSDYELSDYLTDEEIDVIENRGTWSKEKLAQLIIDHYYMYEIGLETIALFKHQVKVAMREIMEEKLPLIYTAAIQYDPLVNVDYTETFSRSSDSESTSKSNSTNNMSGLTVNSDTPQGQISKSNILTGQYASSTGANESETKMNDTSSTEGSGNERYTKKITGNSGSLSTSQKLIQQYRENIIMINRDIIKDIRSLFMTVF